MASASAVLLVVIAATTAIPWAATRSASAFGDGLSMIDPEGPWAFSTLHHVVQLAVTLLVMVAWPGVTLRRFGLTARHWARSWAMLRPFLMWFALWIVGQTVVLALTGQDPIGFERTVRSVTGHLAFQAFVSGTCEEPLFRGLAIVVLARARLGAVAFGSVRVTTANAIATLLFVLAHVQIEHLFARLVELNDRSGPQFHDPAHRLALLCPGYDHRYFHAQQAS